MGRARRATDVDRGGRPARGGPRSSGAGDAPGPARRPARPCASSGRSTSSRWRWSAGRPAYGTARRSSPRRSARPRRSRPACACCPGAPPRPRASGCRRRPSWTGGSGTGRGGPAERSTLEALAEAGGLGDRLAILRRALLPSRAWIMHEHAWARTGRLRLIAAYAWHLARAPAWAARAWRFRRRARRAGLTALTPPVTGSCPAGPAQHAGAPGARAVSVDRRFRAAHGRAGRAAVDGRGCAAAELGDRRELWPAQQGKQSAFAALGVHVATPVGPDCSTSEPAQSRSRNPATRSRRSSPASSAGTRADAGAVGRRSPRPAPGCTAAWFGRAVELQKAVAPQVLQLPPPWQQQQQPAMRPQRRAGAAALDRDRAAHWNGVGVSSARPG